jgi:hypothetical protein
MDCPLLFVSDGFFVALISTTVKFIDDKSTTTNLHLIFFVVDFVANCF